MVESTTPRTALITGASAGIGKAFAHVFARNGFDVVLVARRQDKLDELAADIKKTYGQLAHVIAVDLGDTAAPQRIYDWCDQHQVEVDALVNNAGILEPIARMAEADMEGWRYNLMVNVLGPMMLIQAAIPHLRATAGRVVNVSSGASTGAMVGWASYCASKAALNHMTRVLALEEPGITAVAVRPGIVDTEMQAVIRNEGMAGMTKVDHRRFVERFEQGELVSPERSGRALVKLALYAPRAWSGEFLSWDEQRVEEIMNNEW